MSAVVVFSGSLGSTAEMWEPQLAALEERFEVLRVEHPGHGGAPLADVADLDDLARVLVGQIGVERFSFVGLSLGGAVGMRLAIDVPERVDRLVLACTAARFGDPDSWHDRAALVRAEGVEAVVDVVLPRWFTPGFADLRRYREMFVSTDPEGYARCCDAIARWDARDALGSVRTPTLVIGADDDPSTPPSDLEFVAHEISGARLEIIPNARHLANVEQPEIFNRLLLSHL